MRWGTAWEDYKKEVFGVAINIYEVWKNKKGEEHILLMRAWDVYYVAIWLDEKHPSNRSISALDLNKSYNRMPDISIQGFLSIAAKKYGTAEKVRELILSIERSELKPNLKELDMAAAKKKPAAKKKESVEAIAPAKAKKNTSKVESEVVNEAPTKTTSSSGAQKIKLLVKDNPKREGSASYDRFELYRTSKTVEDFIAAGGSAADVAYDAKKGYIQVS